MFQRTISSKTTLVVIPKHRASAKPKSRREGKENLVKEWHGQALGMSVRRERERLRVDVLILVNRFSEHEGPHH